MNYLIDTHTLLWFLSKSHRLPQITRETIEEGSNEILVSVVSLWEISIKVSSGKLPLTGTITELNDQMLSLGILSIPITVDAMHQVTLLPWHHKDPFDRMIAATSLVRGEILISADRIFDSYGVSRIWS